MRDELIELLRSPFIVAHLIQVYTCAFIYMYTYMYRRKIVIKSTYENIVEKVFAIKEGSFKIVLKTVIVSSYSQQATSCRNPKALR